MKAITLKSIISLLLLTNISMANVQLECKQEYGNSVYKSFLLEIEKDNSYWSGYDLSDLAGNIVTLDGVENKEHEDNDDIGDEWTFVTLGKRSTEIKSNQRRYDFYIETCRDCDFNGARYTYRKTSEGEIFITEMYSSDGSSEFSLYSCTKK